MQKATNQLKAADEIHIFLKDVPDSWLVVSEIVEFTNGVDIRFIKNSYGMKQIFVPTEDLDQRWEVR